MLLFRWRGIGSSIRCQWSMEVVKYGFDAWHLVEKDQLSIQWRQRAYTILYLEMLHSICMLLKYLRKISLWGRVEECSKQSLLCSLASPSWHLHADSPVFSLRPSQCKLEPKSNSSWHLLFTRCVIQNRNINSNTYHIYKCYRTVAIWGCYISNIL